MDKLVKIQAELKAPKSQYNSYGGYSYRNQEDILEAVKPLLLKYGCVLTLDDSLFEMGGRVYVKATATIQDGGLVEAVSAFAREAETQKGMAEAQITGSASSYARKYALNGLFLIDDNKDPDTTNDHGKKPQNEQKKDTPPKKEAAPKKEKPELAEGTDAFKQAEEWVKQGGKIETVEAKYKLSKNVKEKLQQCQN